MSQTPVQSMVCCFYGVGINKKFRESQEEKMRIRNSKEEKKVYGKSKEICCWVVFFFFLSEYFILIETLLCTSQMLLGALSLPPST